ncbi:MAG: hypothetical protein KJ737_26585 [Proteobacteria bacterium]|nr:hypothetical protein [Pseudomonadota bacterium]
MNKLYHALILVFICMLVAGSLPAGAEGVNIHGFISQGYLKTNQNNYLAETDDGSFQFNEMGINFTTFATSDLKIGCQFFARDLGDVGNDEIIINWAFAEYTYRNWLGLRAGILKYAFTLYNETRDFDSLRTSIFLPSSVYNEWLRDGFNKMKGIELFGLTGLGPLGMLEYQFQTGVAPTALNSGTTKYLTEMPTSELGSLTNAEPDTTYAARLIWNLPIDGLRIGGSYIRSGLLYEGTVKDYGLPISIDIKKADVYSFYAEYTYQNLKIAVENYWSESEATSTITLPNGDPYVRKTKTKDGDTYYASLGYRFTDWFEAGYYYSTAEGGADDKGDLNTLEDHCLSLRFDINPNWIAKLEAHVMEGKAGVEPDNDGHVYNEWMLYAAKMSFSF